eukprot:g18484.t1
MARDGNDEDMRSIFRDKRRGDVFFSWLTPCLELNSRTTEDGTVDCTSNESLPDLAGTENDVAYCGDLLLKELSRRAALSAASTSSITEDDRRAAVVRSLIRVFLPDILLVQALNLGRDVVFFLLLYTTSGIVELQSQMGSQQQHQASRIISAQWRHLYLLLFLANSICHELEGDERGNRSSGSTSCRTWLLLGSPEMRRLRREERDAGLRSRLAFLSNSGGEDEVEEVVPLSAREVLPQTRRAIGDDEESNLYNIARWNVRVLVSSIQDFAFIFTALPVRFFLVWLAFAFVTGVPSVGVGRRGGESLGGKIPTLPSETGRAATRFGDGDGIPGGRSTPGGKLEALLQREQDVDVELEIATDGDLAPAESATEDGVSTPSQAGSSQHSFPVKPLNDVDKTSEQAEIAARLSTGAAILGSTSSTTTPSFLYLIIGGCAAISTFLALSLWLVRSAFRISAQLHRAIDYRIDRVGEAVKHVRGLRILRWSHFFTQNKILQARKLERDLFRALDARNAMLAVLLRVFPEVVFFLALLHLVGRERVSRDNNKGGDRLLSVASLVLLRGAVQRLVAILAMVAAKLKVAMMFQFCHTKMMAFWRYQQRPVPQVPTDAFGGDVDDVGEKKRGRGEDVDEDEDAGIELVPPRGRGGSFASTAAGGDLEDPPLADSTEVVHDSTGGCGAGADESQGRGPPKNTTSVLMDFRRPQTPASRQTPEDPQRFTWDHEPTLPKNSPVPLTLQLPEGFLLQVGDVCAVAGTSHGSGKSMLCHALLGELHPTPQNPTRPNKDLVVCYAPQNPFLLDASVRKNVLFGLPRDDEYFHAAMRICALSENEVASVLPDDELRTNGGNLSGGQRQRLH